MSDPSRGRGLREAEARASRQPATLPPMALGQYRSALAARHYDDIDPNLLRALPNPGEAMELKHKAPEVTFLGAHDQPDFGTLYVTFYPGEKVIELRSLKEYLAAVGIRDAPSWRYLEQAHNRLRLVDPRRQGAVPGLGWPRHLVDGPRRTASRRHETTSPCV